MIRWFFGSLAVVLATQIQVRADAALLKSDVLESNVAYLRVGAAGKNLADEISAAESALAVSNKTVGMILDLRFADGDDAGAAKMAADFFAAQKTPLAILVNGETRGAAEKLAVDLREARAGLIFGSAAADLQPDIAVAVKPADEKKFLENPYLSLAQSETNFTGANSPDFSPTNNFASMIDHTSEADLVRQKIKDGSDEEDDTPIARPLPSKPVIRDPALARAVDFLKALAILPPARG